MATEHPLMEGAKHRGNHQQGHRGISDVTANTEAQSYIRMLFYVCVCIQYIYIYIHMYTDINIDIFIFISNIYVCTLYIHIYRFIDLEV